MSKLRTLCIIRKGDQVLLGMKKRRFGAGFWNGFGGKLNSGESMIESLRREIIEEAGVTPLDLVKKGILHFQFAIEPFSLEVHVFECSDFSGQPAETEEMRPQWFSIAEIPYELMWPDDRHWLPILISGKKFRGKFKFSDYQTLLGYNVKEVPNLE